MEALVAQAGSEKIRARRIHNIAVPNMVLFRYALLPSSGKDLSRLGLITIG
jgi:hypothetical protein